VSAALLRCAWERVGAKILLSVRAYDGSGFCLAMAPRAAAALVVNGQGSIDTVGENFESENWISAELTINERTSENGRADKRGDGADGGG
jgi:hypothetical protein